MSVYIIYSSLRYYNQVTSKLDSAPVAEPKLLVKQNAGYNLPYLFLSIDSAAKFLYNTLNVENKVSDTVFLSKYRSVANSSYLLEFTKYTIKKLDVL